MSLSAELIKEKKPVIPGTLKRVAQVKMNMRDEKMRQSMVNSKLSRLMKRDFFMTLQIDSSRLSMRRGKTQKRMKRKKMSIQKLRAATNTEKSPATIKM